MKIVNNANKEISANEVSQRWLHEGKGLVVCVFESVASIAMTFKAPNQTQKFISFRSGLYEEHTLTEAKNVLTRILELIEDPAANKCEFYYFPTLKDFAYAVIENNWKWNKSPV